MNRPLTAGISIVLLSALAVPGAKAETRVEAQLRLTHPNQIAINHPIQSAENSNQKKAASMNEGQPNAETEKKLSERDRIIQEYRTQTVVPAQ